MADLGTLDTFTFNEPFELSLNTWSSRNISLNPVRPMSLFGNDFWVTAQGVLPEDAKTISGTVRNSAGAGIARTVVAYDQTLKAVVATTTSAGDGTFSFKVPYANRCSVFHVPELADSRNGVILSNLVPI